MILNPHKYYTDVFQKLKLPTNILLIGEIIDGDNGFLKKHASVVNIYETNTEQEGGYTKLNFKYGNYTFSIFQNEDRDNINFGIFNNDIPITKNNNVTEVCAYMQIPKKENMIYIQNISKYPNCVKEGLPKSKAGSILLQGILKFIDSIKDKYKLEYIRLRDTSHIYCEENRTSIDLSSLYMLTKGTTWYNKYGFIPSMTTENKPDIENLVKLEVNKKLVEKTKVKCTKVGDLLLREISKMKVEKNIIKMIKEMIEKYNNRSIKEFMYNFMETFGNTCQLYSEISKELIEEIGLYNLHGISYVKNLKEEKKYTTTVVINRKT